MLEAFPPPTTTVTKQQIDNGATPNTVFGDMHGIYGMFPFNEEAYEASGHVDIFHTHNKTKVKECIFECSWGAANIIYLWDLN